MIRIFLSFLATVALTVSLLDLAPEGMWIQLFLLSAASFTFGLLIMNECSKQVEL